MQPIKVERPFTSSEAGDIAVTAAEGGIGYWAVIDSYKPSRWFDHDTLDITEVDDDFVFYTLSVEDGENVVWYDVTPIIIRNGVQAYLKTGRFWDMEDFASMDAAEADCVIQLGLFGEVRYA